MCVAQTVASVEDVNHLLTAVERLSQEERLTAIRSQLNPGEEERIFAAEVRNI